MASPRREWVVTTYCDYGRMGHKSPLTRHLSERAAARAWKQYEKYYTKFYPHYRLWQENRNHELVNNMGIYGNKQY